MAALGRRHPAGGVVISASYSVDRRRTKGITLKVSNNGTRDLPPYGVCLKHPEGGTYFFFPSDKSGPLLVHQRRDHRCILIENECAVDWLPHVFRKSQGGQIEKDDEERFSLCLVLDESDKILYENRKLGAKLADFFRRTLEHGSEVAGEGGGTWSDWNELNNAGGG